MFLCGHVFLKKRLRDKQSLYVWIRSSSSFICLINGIKTDPVSVSVRCLPAHGVRLLCCVMLLILSALIGHILGCSVLSGRSESTCGPAGHPTERRELCRSESSLLEELLTHVMTPLAAMVAAQRHSQAQYRTKTRIRQCCWIRWFGGFEAFSGRVSFIFGFSCFQNTSQSQI